MGILRSYNDKRGIDLTADVPNSLIPALFPIPRARLEDPDLRSSEAKTPFLPSKREAYLFPALRRTVTSFSYLIFTITEVALVFFVVWEKMKLERFSHLSQASFPGSSLWAAMCPTPVPRLSPGPAWAGEGR